MAGPASGPASVLPRAAASGGWTQKALKRTVTPAVLNLEHGFGGCHSLGGFGSGCCSEISTRSSPGSTLTKGSDDVTAAHVCRGTRSGCMQSPPPAAPKVRDVVRRVPGPGRPRGLARLRLGSPEPRAPPAMGLLRQGALKLSVCGPGEGVAVPGVTGPNQHPQGTSRDAPEPPPCRPD